MDSIRSVILLLLSVSTSTGSADVYEYAADSGTSELGQQPGNTYEQFPATYVIWFEHDGQLLYLNLYRDDMMTKSLNPSIFKLTSYLPDDLMTDDNENDFAFYHNGEEAQSDIRAGFVLYRSPRATNAKVFGFYRLNGQQFFLEHDRDSEHKTRRDVSKDAIRSKRSFGQPEKLIEVFVWSAPDVLRFHRARLGVNVRQTETFLRAWERSIIRDADLVFRTLDTTDLGLYYVGSGNDRNTGVKWYSNNVDGRLILRDAVDDISAELQDLVANNLIPAFDHAVVLTRQDIVDTFAGQGQDKIAYGAPGSICQSPAGSSVSMAEVSSPFFIKAVAQSIIFSFGIPYYFLGAEYTVMSRSINTNIPFAERASRWQFDQVTADLIKTKVDELDGQCLDTVAAGDFDYSAFIGSLRYGELYPTLQEQCQIFAGSASDVCQGDNSTSVCYDGVKCLNLKGLCRLDYFTGAGTPCSGSGDCNYGDCLSAPGTTENTNLASSTVVCKCEQFPLGEVQLSSRYTPCAMP